MVIPYFHLTFLTILNIKNSYKSITTSPCLLIFYFDENLIPSQIRTIKTIVLWVCMYTRVFSYGSYHHPNLFPIFAHAKITNQIDTIWTHCIIHTFIYTCSFEKKKKVGWISSFSSSVTYIFLEFLIHWLLMRDFQIMELQWWPSPIVQNRWFPYIRNIQSTV